jgi:NADH:ubiquinone oxidoreductase subunit E
MSKSTTTDSWPQVRAAARRALGEDIADYVEACREKPHPESHLIGVLHRVQESFNYLPREQLEAVAQLLQVPATVVTGVATFYHFFRLTPQGKHQISICMGTACYVKGAQAVADKFKDELGVDFGETSGDGVFTLQGSRCLGTCGLAPVVMIDDDVHGQVTPDQVPALLAEYRKES